ncbi:MAG: hypothetical protein HYS15_00140 [Candidatus Spechtbacteria bacterium]|nr:hypothetical protein [Candidatus Spechtbacteria bacterium]
MRELARTNFSPYWRRRPSDTEMLQRIKDFYIRQGRIPLKKEFNNTYKEYKRRFGSWNRAVELAGFEPHRVIFSKKFFSQDGHVCDSFAEKIIDDWFSRNKIFHIRNVPYGSTKMTADFAMGDMRVEYFGLTGEVQGYDEVIRKKRDLCAKLGLKLVEIYPSELFSKDFKKCLGRILWEVKGSA